MPYGARLSATPNWIWECSIGGDHGGDTIQNLLVVPNIDKPVPEKVETVE
jgi:hypothetical protein